MTSAIIIFLCLLSLCGAQLNIVCSKGSEFTTKLLYGVIDANRNLFRTYSPIRVPGLEENFGFARLYNCGFAGLENTEFTQPVGVLCDGEGATNRVVLSIYVALNKADIICQLALGMAPTLAAHTEVDIRFDKMELTVDLQVPKNRRSKVKVEATKLLVTSIKGQRIIMTGLEPVTSILSQGATMGLRIMPKITQAFFSEFLKLEMPKILAKVKLPF